MATHSSVLVWRIPGTEDEPFQFTSIHGPNIPGSYAILLFTASDLASITSHIHNWVLFSLWLHLFILSRVISPLISSRILGTYRPGEFIFQCHLIFFFFDSLRPHGLQPTRLLRPWDFPGKSTGVGRHCLLRRCFFNLFLIFNTIRETRKMI